MLALCFNSEARDNVIHLGTRHSLSCLMNRNKKHILTVQRTKTKKDQDGF